MSKTADYINVNAKSLKSAHGEEFKRILRKYNNPEDVDKLKMAIRRTRET